MNYLIGCFLSLLIAMNCFAEPANSLPANLIKLTNENNPKCVEFVSFQGEMYCSLVPLDKTPVDPKVFSYEKQKIQFDNRPWKAAWGQKTKEITTIEYLVIGDDINNWSELVTSQFMPGFEGVTPAEFGNRFLDSLNKSGITYTVKTIEDQPNQLIYEFKVQKPDNLQQDEIQKITKGKDGMYILHYAVKKADMDETTRQKWIDNMKKSTLKN